MTVAEIIALISQVGFPLASKLIDKWMGDPKATVTPDEWNVLKVLGQNTALSQMKAALARAGIPETDPHAQALLAQVPQ